MPLPGHPNATIAIVAAAIASIILWSAVFLARRANGPELVPAPSLSPAEEFRLAVRTMSRQDPRGTAAQLSVAARRYLARIDAGLGRDLTSRELLRLASSRADPAAVTILAEVLREGDAAKFSLDEVDAALVEAILEDSSQLPELLERGTA